jgi:hypothetical protein
MAGKRSSAKKKLCAQGVSCCGRQAGFIEQVETCAAQRLASDLSDQSI